jgi:hypothetical protein
MKEKNLREEAEEPFGWGGGLPLLHTFVWLASVIYTVYNINNTTV